MGDWKEIIVGSSAEILAGYAFDSKQFVDKSKGIPLIRIRDLKRGHTEVNYVGKFQDRYIIEEDDVLIGMDGDFHVVRWKGIRALLNQRVLKVTAKGGLDNNLLYYFLVGELIKIQNQITGTTVKHLSNSNVAEIRINVPEDIIEQYTIANILTTIDQVIEKTEQLIAKYERIKTGLMQDLLTRGIDEQGNIRSEETHEFKDSPLGRIPVEWNWNRLTNMVDEVLDFKANGSFERLTANVKYYNESNYGRLIRLTDLRQNLSNNGVYVDEIGYNFLTKTSLKEGDILISCVGEYTGFVCRMPKVPYPATIAPNMFLIRFKEDFDSRFINYYMNFSTFQRQIAEVSTSSATKLLNNPNLRALKFAYPKRKEQEQIVKYIEPVSEQIEGCKNELKNLNNLKTGLMQDLLTGKVRVANLLNNKELFTSPVTS